MVNILILFDKSDQARQLTGSLLRAVPDLKARIAQTLDEAEQISQDMRLRLVLVDQKLIAGQMATLAERLRRPPVNRFLPIVLLQEEDAAKPPALELSESALISLGMLSCPFPFDPAELKKLLERIFIEWRLRDHRPNPRVFIDQSGAARWLPEDDIVFVEYASRRVVIHTRKETIEYKYMPLQKFAAKLSSQFVQVHQSYVVNFSAVKSYNRQQSVLKLSGSPQLVPVGRSYQKSVSELVQGLGEN